MGLGDQIRSARQRAGLTQEQLWEKAKLSVSRAQLSNYENENSMMPLDVAAQLVAALADALQEGLTIGPCRLCQDSAFKKGSQTAPDEQLCFDFGTEYEFKNVILRIKPGRESILINAVVPNIPSKRAGEGSS